MKIKLDQAKDGKWFWKLVAVNGETLAHSESYSSRAKAKQTACKVATALSVIVKVV